MSGKRMKHPLYNGKGNSQGHTLIEFAIVLIIVGLFIAGAMTYYSTYIQKKKMDETITNVSYATDRIQSFRSNSGRFPCPAPLSVARTDASYGQESDCNGVAISAMNPADCANGICVEESIRLTLPDGTPLTLPERRVIVGALPFRALQIDEDKTFDGYGSRMLYAVSLTATTQATFDEQKGAIAIRDENGTPLTLVDGSALFTVISHGGNKVGAYSNTGTLSNACAGVGLDLENCTDGFSSGIGELNSVYISTRENGADGADFFDDTINYFSQISQPAWRRTDANQEDIQDLSNRFVGAGISLPNAELDINSTGATDSLRVYGTNKLDGTVTTDSICTETGADCFDPIVITGDNTNVGEGMKCPVGEFMVGISNGGPVCEDEIEVKCDQDLTKPIMVGLNADGTPKCVAPPASSCPDQVRTPCVSDPANTVNVLTGPDGTLRPGPAAANYFATTFGDCRKVRYTCNAGVWTESATGHCVFTPTTTTNTPSCKVHYGNQCGWQGNVNQTVTTLCAGGSATSNDTSACQCLDESCPKTVDCRTYFGSTNYNTGINISYTETVTCPTGPTGPRNVTNDLAAVSKAMCTCVETTRAIFDTCANRGLPGYIRKAAPIPASFAPVDWPANTNYGVYKTRTVDTTNCSYADSAWDTSNCECNSALQYTKSTVTCADPVCEVPDTAPSGNSYPTIGAAQKGWDVFEHTVDASTCTRVDPGTQVQTGVCKALGFKWVNLGTSGATATVMPSDPNYVNSSCTCQDHKDTVAITKTCFLPADPSKTIYNCKCQ